MKHGLLLIALFIAATALTSGEHSLAYMAHSPKTTTTHSPKTTTTHSPKTTTTHSPKTTTTHSPNTTTTHSPNTTTTHSPKTTTTHSPKTTTTHSPNTTTTHSPNTTTTHSPNTTTTHSPNTTTTHSPNTTTTHSPNTTTTHSPNTTTTHSPNTTTHNPNSTTTTPSTTTSIPMPTPSTNMTTGNYNFSDGKSTLCVMVVAAIAIRVNTSEVNGTFIVQPSKTNVSGNCSEEVASLIISFKEGDISLQFQNNKTTKKVYVKFVQYKLTYAFNKGVLSKYTGMNRSLELFSVDLGYSYSCKDETVYMGGGVSLDLTQYRFQAFDIKNKNFGPPELCKADQPDYRVPIAVGVILIILIIIVVIAYLISRKRRTDGYQSL